MSRRADPPAGEKEVPIWAAPLRAMFAGTRRHEGALADYTVTARVFPISLLAIVIGVICTYVAVALLKLIGLFTHLFFFQNFGTDLISPAKHHLGAWVLVVPVLGGLLVGLMARFGSEKIRGHGMPEAIEAIMLKAAKVSPRVAFFKPVSAAVAIGSGGPFGAEGPIIMTGGAFGSLIAQFFQLTDAERRTLLVAGSAAGMAAIFAAPVSAVLLAVELLLFEWKPRSLVPVALASAVAGAARKHLIGMGPIFPTVPHAAYVGPRVLVACAVIGVLSALLAAILSFSIYRVEDTFDHVPIHWMWWPAIGGLFIGIGGMIFPRALGVGYDVIADLVAGNLTWHLVIGILLVKSAIWALSLGSGTSGGIVAPILMIGGALGGAMSLLSPTIFPDAGAGFWPLMSMAAVLGGSLGTPLTGIVFVIELTHDFNLALPLMIACVISYLCTTLILPRSILTERISRRGYHLSREYSVDPLEIIFVKEVMRSNIIALPAELRVIELQQSVRDSLGKRGQYIYPIVAQDQLLVGLMTRSELIEALEKYGDGHPASPRLSEIARREMEVAFPDEPLRAVAQRMANTGLTRMPVVERRARRAAAEEAAGQLVGIVSLADLLKGRVINMEAERKRERVFPVRIFIPRFGRSTKTSPPDSTT